MKRMKRTPEAVPHGAPEGVGEDEAGLGHAGDGERLRGQDGARGQLGEVGAELCVVCCVCVGGG